MSSTATSSNPRANPQAHTETLALLDPFLAILRSPSPITLPDASLFGGITHFLSVLPSPHLQDFISALIASPSLWNSRTSQRALEVRHAVRLSVSAKAESIKSGLESAYLSTWKGQRCARSWLAHALKGIERVHDHPSGRMEVLLGLIEGLDDAPGIDWGQPRSQLEEDVVIGLADMLSKAPNDETEKYSQLCSAAIHVGEHRLRALPLVERSDDIMDNLFTELRHSIAVSDHDIVTSQNLTTSRLHTGTPQFSLMSQAIARLFVVLDHGGPSSRQASWRLMSKFCTKMDDLGERLKARWLDVEHTDDVWDNHKTVLFSFLLPASAALDILLADDPPSIARRTLRLPDGNHHPSAVLALQILGSLKRFSYLIENSKGGLERYDRLLYGTLDVLVAKGGVEGVKLLMRQIESSNEVSEAEDAFNLVIGEQLINLMDGKDVGKILEICQRHINRPSHRTSFEAAHAFLLALVEKASSSSQAGVGTKQIHLLEELVRFYPGLLLDQAISGSISADQLRSAYPMVVRAASTLPRSHLENCLSLLDQYPSDLSEKLAPQSSLLLIKISLLQYIPPPLLPSYLDGIARLITALPPGSERRLELSAEAFKAVIESLGDEGKLIGIEWWLRWRGVFEKRADPRQSRTMRARL